MSDVKQKSRAIDRRPAEVPHHPRVLVVAAIVSSAALLFMGAWFWNVMTSKGLILTAEQQAAAREQQNADDAADTLSDSDRARQQEDAQPKPTDVPGSRHKGGIPPAPDASDPVTTDAELTDYSILSVNGILQVGGTVKNTSANPLSGTLKAYIYIDRVPVATAKTDIQNLQPDDTQKVNMVSDSEWTAGDKVLQLEFRPHS